MGEKDLLSVKEVTNMDDEKIIALYRERNENAIKETKLKYGRYCRTIANNILHSHEDAEECENDTYFDAWNAIPPQIPLHLSVFLGTITRRIALDKWRKASADKRGGGETIISLSELEECIPEQKTIDEEIETQRLAEILSYFLKALSESESNLFIRRYFYFDSIAHIAARYGFTQSKVKMSLKRTREKLRIYLEKEGIYL